MNPKRLDKLNTQQNLLEIGKSKVYTEDGTRQKEKKNPEVNICTI